MNDCGWRAGNQLHQQRWHDHQRAIQRRRTHFFHEEMAMNIWTILGPILIAFLQKLIDRKAGGARAAAADDHAELDRWATELEQHVNTRGAAAAASDGLIVQVQRLIAAFRARDYAAALAIVFEILSGSPGTAPPA
jgi:hypothetical protein